MITTFRSLIVSLMRGSIGTFLTVSVVFSPAGIAATVQGGSDGIMLLELPVEYTIVQLDGDDGTQLSSKNGMFETEDGFSDGFYTYKILTEVAVEPSARRNEPMLDNGRDPNVKPASFYLKTIESKRFLIMDGLVVNPDLAEE
ncbi:hypothetical protein [Litoribrevibacter albus]|uniref:Uncharacterized protein n=1 Tax=Litoribrevibacter albus TaxID=1473156 RepID=A0AA37SC87_9GAMM|nr:hypothetical protein [Litoribrevibacter albus]GLQ32123.1 hypothetical protein GCM10007876_26020 [Litoribrevibacter albus]